MTTLLTASYDPRPETGETMYDPQTGVHTFVKTIANAETLGILLAFVFRQAIFKFFPLQFFVVFFSPSFFPRPFFPYNFPFSPRISNRQL
jgi:hypothetical protein